MDNSMNNTSTPTGSTSMDMAMTMGMTPWLHFGTNDHLFFKAWQPGSHGAIAGACLGLIVFCMLERALAAFRRAQEARWSAQPICGLSSSSMHSILSKGVDSEASGGGGTPFERRTLMPPFSPVRDVSRGVVQALQATFGYALMLIVMTYNGAFIISVILGLGIGEVLFGRIARAHDV